jgi:phage host-nuclease inhibitor protein Gam
MAIFLKESQETVISTDTFMEVMSNLSEAIVEQGKVMENMLREDFIVHEQSRTLNEAEATAKKEGLVSKTWQALKDFLKKIKDAVVKVWNWIKQKIQDFWNFVKRKFQDVKYFFISKYMQWRIKRTMVKAGMAKEMADHLARGSVEAFIKTKRRFDEEGRSMEDASHEEMIQIAANELGGMMNDLAKSAGASAEELEAMNSMIDQAKVDPSALHAAIAAQHSVAADAAGAMSGLARAKAHS